MKKLADHESYYEGARPKLHSKRGELRIQILNVPSRVASGIIEDIQEHLTGYACTIQYSFLKEGAYESSGTVPYPDGNL